MTHNKIRALWLGAAVVLCGLVLSSSARVASAQDAPSAEAGSRKILKVRFAVMHMFYQSIQVRSLTRLTELHTFTYSPGLRDKMQAIFNAGGYQYGDEVVVWYRPSDNVAVRIKGKPSKQN